MHICACIFIYCFIYYAQTHTYVIYISAECISFIAREEKGRLPAGVQAREKGHRTGGRKVREAEVRK